MRIVTYADPFKINQNQELWELITQHPHYCASDTLVQGLTSCYERNSFSIIRPVQDLIDSFFGIFTSNPINDLQMFLSISSYIRSWPESEIKDTFLFNKADVVKAVQHLIPLKINTEKFDKHLLSNEQCLFLDILNTVYDSESYKAFELIDSFGFEEYKSAVSMTEAGEIVYLCQNGEFDELLREHNINIQKAKHNIDEAKHAVAVIIDYLDAQQREFPDEKNVRRKDTFSKAVSNFEINEDTFFKTVIIDGVHKITPILYYMIHKLESIGVNVVIMINYADNLPAIYETWEKVYGWCGCQFEYAESLNIDSGNEVGRNIALSLSGKNILPVSNEDAYEIKKYDNMSSFAMGEVARIFRNADRHNPQRRLSRMKKQFYAVNSEECNELLKMYFPEQFKEKPFLSYPIGQLILGLYQMWDFDTDCIRFDFRLLSECAVSGLFENSTVLLELLHKAELYFSDIELKDDFDRRISLLRSATEVAHTNPMYVGWEKVSFFSLSMSEIDTLKDFFDTINEYACSIFKGMSEQVDYLKHFRSLMNIIENGPTAEGRVLSTTETALISNIKEKLQSDSVNDINGNSKDVTDALAFFLSERKSSDSSNWIVRDFDQIDGAVLLSSGGRTRADTYHFALLSNEHMLKPGPHELPWPLTESMFCSYSEAEQSILAVTAAHKEHRSYLKYILFYGAFFSKKQIEFSFLGEEKGNSQKPYYLLEAIGMSAKPANDSYTRTLNFAADNIDSGVFNPYCSEESKEFFSICPYRFLAHDVIGADVIYYSEFHLKYYISYLLTYIVREKVNAGHPMEAAFSEEVLTFRKYFPFWSEVDFGDIFEDAKKNILRYPSNNSKIHRRKQNFLVGAWKTPSGQDLFDMQDSLSRMDAYMHSSRLYPNADELPPKGICDDCNYSSVCLRNYYDAHIEEELNNE